MLDPPKLNLMSPSTRGKTSRSVVAAYTVVAPAAAGDGGRVPEADDPAGLTGVSQATRSSARNT